MAGSYPASVTAYTSPGPTDVTGVAVGGRTHDQLHADSLDDLEAVMTRLGTVGTPGSVPVKLATTGVLGSPLSVASFISISGAYAHLELRIYGRSTASVTLEGAVLRVNGDSGANYWGEILYATGASAGGAEHPVGSNHALLGYVPGASSSNAGWFGAITVAIPGYAVAQFHPMTADSYVIYSATTGDSQVRTHGMIYAGAAAAITQLDVQPASGSWAAGSILSLYGLP